MFVPLVLVLLAGQAPSPAPASPPPPAMVEATTQTPWPPPGVTRPGPGIVAPKAVTRTHASYTAAAMRARIEGVVHMEAVVLTDGSVGDVRVTRSLDREHGLDDEAVLALKLWRFEPGTRDGVAIPVLVEVQMSFSLGPAGQDAAPAPAPPPMIEATVRTPQGLARPDPAIVHPRVLRDVKPRYTEAAMRARVQGTVHMQAVVLPDGTVGDVRVVTPLHDELDARAIAALKQWEFAPGTKDGVAVAVMVTIEMAFTLRDKEADERPVSQGAAAKPAPRADVVRPGAGIRSPRLIREVKPNYTAEAMRADIEGTVGMEAVVEADGTVNDVRVTRSLDSEHGLDEEAVKTVRQWRFEPGSRDGVAVPVLVEIEMVFVKR